MPQLNLIELRQARLVPPGLAVTRAGEMVFSCKQFSIKTIQQEWLKGLPVTQFGIAGQHNSGRPLVCLTHPGDRIFGHWLVDLLPLVWLAETRYPGRADFLVAADAPRFALELLQYMGVQENRVIRWDRTQGALEVALLWIVSPGRFNQFSHPIMADYARDFRDRLLSHAPGARNATPKRIWVSRQGWRAQTGKLFRILTNASDIEAMASKFGFHAVCPETLTIPEQAALFSDAQSIAGEDGSALHMSLFAGRDLRVGNFRSNANGSLIQGSLCGLAGQSISYAFGEAIDRPTKGRSANFFVEPSDAEKLFESIASNP